MWYLLGGAIEDAAYEMQKLDTFCDLIASV